MRRFLGVMVAAVILAGCSDVTESLVPEGDNDEELANPEVSFDLIDGSTLGGIAAGGSEYFFFLSPLVPNPDYSGVFESGLDPVVTIENVECPENENSSFCDPSTLPDTLVVFNGASITEGTEQYSVVWKTNEYPVLDGGKYLITVEVVLPQVTDPVPLGSVDVLAFNQTDYNSFKHTHPDLVAISDNGSANIAFRIEEGLLEQEYCPADQIEDCDVAIFTYDEEGCLKVFNQPDAQGYLGSQTCLPASSAQVGGNPVSEFVAIMTLEEPGTTQGSSGAPAGWQIPFFPDVQTIPDGIEFGEAGAIVTICQELGLLPTGVDHDFLRPFIILSDNTVVLPDNWEWETDAEGYDPNVGSVCTDQSTGGITVVAEADQPGGSSILHRLAQGFSKATRFFQPKPLQARRRLHGGLNTVVWDIPPGEEEEAGVAAQDRVAEIGPLNSPPPPPTSVLELGALLDISMIHSWADIPSDQLSGEEVIIEVHALDPTEAYFPFEVPVIVTVVYRETGDTLLSDLAAWGPSQSPPAADSSYTFTYTPTVVGTYDITISIEGEELDGPFSNEVKPLSGPLTVSVDVVGDEGAPWTDQVPENGLPVRLYNTDGSDVTDATGNTVVGQLTDDSGEVIFPDVIFATYTVQIEKRDFDMDFTGVNSKDPQVITEAMTMRDFDHAQGGSAATFTTYALEIPAGTEIWRVGNNGNGNAFEYVESGRSWTSAQNQVREAYLHETLGHLATALSLGESTFIKGLFPEDDPNCTDPTAKKCKTTGWLGLSDDVEEGSFVWVTGQSADWFNWDPDQNFGVDGLPLDRKGNLDHVEIAPTGYWSVINGASSTNDGYFVEWDVVWPNTPPFPAPSG